MMLNKLLKTLGDKLSDAPKQLLEQKEKNVKLLETVESYKQKLKEYSGFAIERNLYAELTTAFARAVNFDELFKAALTVFSTHLKARYYGIFWMDSAEENFVFRFGKGYQAAELPRIPRQGSLMGRCFDRCEVFFAKDLAAESSHIALAQEPREYNALFAPVILLGRPMGVVVMSNLDPESAATAVAALKAVVPLLGAGLERLLFQEQNDRNQRALSAVHQVARALEESPDETGIFSRVCPEVLNLFPCVACLAVEVSPERGPLVKITHPQKFHLGGNPESEIILLRNLMAEYPSGEALITNLHADKRWAWADSSVRSLCMVPVKGEKPFRLIAVGPSTEFYTVGIQDRLELLANQASVTLERAAHFRLQEELARKDGLTGLLNHRVFQETIRDEVERGKRYKRTLSLIMIDIDNFKKYNDKYGHPAGDQVIRMVAGHLKHDPRITDRSFRYGGEEFCILLPETPADKAQILAERIRNKVASEKGFAEQVTLSMGVTVHRSDEGSQAFLERADQALYNAKKTGKNKVVLF